MKRKPKVENRSESNDAQKPKTFSALCDEHLKHVQFQAAETAMIVAETKKIIEQSNKLLSDLIEAEQRQKKQKERKAEAIRAKKGFLSAPPTDMSMNDTLKALENGKFTGQDAFKVQRIIEAFKEYDEVIKDPLYAAAPFEGPCISCRIRSTCMIRALGKGDPESMMCCNAFKNFKTFGKLPPVAVGVAKELQAFLQSHTQ